MRRGRPRNATPKSVKGENKDEKTNNEKSESEKSEPPISWEYETEDGLKIAIKPGEAEISREYELTENDLIEFGAAIDFSTADIEVKKKGLDLEVSGEVSLPGNLLGVGGEIIIDLKSGEIIGGKLGVEIGGVGVEVGVEGEDGCKKSLTVSIGPFSITYSRDDCNDEEPEPPAEPIGPIEVEGIPPVDLGIVITNTPDPAIYISCPVGMAVYTTDRPSNFPYGYEVAYSDIGYTDTTNFNGPNISVSGDNYSVSGWGGTSLGISVYGEYTPPGKNPVPRRFVKTYVSLVVAVYAWPDRHPVGPYCVKPDSRKNKTPPPPPIPPIRKKAMDKCCAETLALLQDIHDALNVDEILNKGVKTPNRLIAYGASKQTTHKDYLSLLAFVIREIDHLGIHPFEVNISDTNPALEGDQSVSLEFVNATAVAKQLIELSLENKGDSAARLNLQVRSARIQVQILNAVVVISRMVQGMINYIGMPIREIVDNVTMPFDITLGNRRKFSGKGFGNAKKPDLIQEINKNTEQATEEILDKFLKEEKQPVVSETYDANEPGLLELIQRFIKR